MSYITLEQGPAARKFLLQGATKLRDAVAASMGPAGRNMYFEQHENVFLTKDGATIARWIHSSRLIDSFERAGSAIMRKPSMKTEEEAGDGTTAATVLSYAMMQSALKSVDQGANVMGIERGMRKAFDQVATFLDSMKRDAKDRNAWEKVAYISSRDAEIAETIGKAMETVGPTGHIRVEPGDDWREHELTLEIKQGMTFPRGYATDTAINDRVNLKCVLKDAPILVTNLELYTEKDAILLSGIAEAVYKQGYKRLAIVARKFAGRVTDFILQNNIPYHQRGGERGDGMLVLPIEAPGMDSIFTHEFCDDIACLTGATLISPASGTKLEYIPIDENVLKKLGMCEVIESKKKETNIINSKANPEAIAQRVAEIKAKIESEQKEGGELDKKHHEERLAMLTTGMAVITVGGRHTENIAEKKSRVDDAVLATKCAYEEGIVPGAGIAYMRASEIIDTSMVDDGSEREGMHIVQSAMMAPLVQIAKNCGIGEVEVVTEASTLKGAETFNMQKGKLETVDAFDDGVVDPLKVVKSALRNAIEGAITFITVEVVGVSLPEDKNGQPIWEVIRGDAARKTEVHTESLSYEDWKRKYENDLRYKTIACVSQWRPRLLGRLLQLIW